MAGWADVFMDLISEGGKTAIHHGGMAIAKSTYAKPASPLGRLGEVSLAPLPTVAPPPWEGQNIAFDPPPWQPSLPITEKPQEGALEARTSDFASGGYSIPREDAFSAPEGAVSTPKGDMAGSYSDEWGEDLSIACAACTMRHLSTMTEAYRTAADTSDADERKRNLAIAAGEGLVWSRYDMTPAKLARTPADKLRAVMEAKRHIDPLMSDTPKAPEKLVLAWASVGEALRFANSANPKPTDKREVEVRMQDVIGLVGYLESTQEAKDHLPSIREARHRWTQEGFTPEALSFAEERLGRAVEDLTPDPGPDTVRKLYQMSRRANEAFFDAFFHGKGKPVAPDVSTIDFRHAFVDQRKAPADLVDRYTSDRGADGMFEALGSTPGTREAFARLAEFDRLRNVPVRDQPLPADFTPDGGWEAIHGAYFPDSNNILVGPQSVVGDAGDVYTLAEETAHSLLHSNSCDIYSPDPGTAYEDLPQEKEAKTAALLALLSAGVPFEDDSGRPVNPKSVRFDVRAAEADMGPKMLGRVIWAANLIADALKGDIEGAAARSAACPK